jgi:glycosyltransferase involved in cell wall biosynthesis
VHKVVPRLRAEPAGRRSRAAIGLGDEFTFLFVYDAASVVKRKNPGAAVAAFRRAFRPDEPVRLLLKTTAAVPRQVAALHRLAGPARVELRNGYLHHGELLDLVAACDAYVSLHRSEGLGLTLLDALLLGKPVVATPYSGVTEFFAGPGTYPVAFREAPLVRSHGPYPRGAVWAEPDVADAARQMRALYAEWCDPSRRPSPPGEAQLRQYGLAATLPPLMERLEAIRSLLGAGVRPA